MPATNFPTPISSTCNALLGDASGLAVLATCTGVPPTTANVFQVGCQIIQTDAASTFVQNFYNTGTSAVPVWSLKPTSAGQLSHATPAAINLTAAATAAQVATGYITSTSASPTTITLPTGTLLGAAIGAVQGTVLDLYIDNTAGASTVTMAVAVNGVKSDAANTTAASFGQMTVASGVTGLAKFTLMFSSPTAYAFTRTA